MILVKENHIRALGGRQALFDALRSAGQAAFVEVEVDSLEFLKDLIQHRVDRVMLDNFTPDEVRSALGVIDAHKMHDVKHTVEVEVSGGITLANIRDYAIRDQGHGAETGEVENPVARG